MHALAGITESESRQTNEGSVGKNIEYFRREDGKL